MSRALPIDYGSIVKRTISDPEMMKDLHFVHNIINPANQLTLDQYKNRFANLSLNDATTELRNYIFFPVMNDLRYNDLMNHFQIAHDRYGPLEYHQFIRNSRLAGSLQNYVDIYDNDEDEDENEDEDDNDGDDNGEDDDDMGIDLKLKGNPQSGGSNVIKSTHGKILMIL